MEYNPVRLGRLKPNLIHDGGGVVGKVDVGKVQVGKVDGSLWKEGSC
jgi:hypothetical protein